MHHQAGCNIVDWHSGLGMCNIAAAPMYAAGTFSWLPTDCLPLNPPRPTPPPSRSLPPPPHPPPPTTSNLGIWGATYSTPEHLMQALNFLCAITQWACFLECSTLISYMPHCAGVRGADGQRDSCQLHQLCTAPQCQAAGSCPSQRAAWRCPQAPGRCPPPNP